MTTENVGWKCHGGDCWGGCWKLIGKAPTKCCPDGTCRLTCDFCGRSCSVGNKQGISDAKGNCYVGQTGCNLTCIPPEPEIGYERILFGECKRSGVFKCGDNKVCDLRKCKHSDKDYVITGGWEGVEYPSKNFVVGDTVEIKVKGVWTAVNGEKNNAWTPLIECKLEKYDKEGKEVGGVYLNAWGTGDITLNYTIKPHCSQCFGCEDCFGFGSGFYKWKEHKLIPEKVKRKGMYHCHRCKGGAAGCERGCDTSGVWRIAYCGVWTDFVANGGWNLAFDQKDLPLVVSTGLIVGIPTG